MKTNRFPLTLSICVITATTLQAAAVSPACESANRQALSLLASELDDEAQMRLSRLASRLEGSNSTEDKICLAITLHNQTSALEHLGRLDLADQAAARSISLFEEILGPYAVSIRRPLQLRVSLAMQKGRWDRAAHLLARAEALPAPNPTDIALVEALRAKLLIHEGKLSDAESAYRKAIALREQSGTDNSPGMGVTLTDLGILYINEGRLAEALALMQQALKIAELYPLNIDAHARAILNVALALSANHEEKAADDCFRQATNLFAGLPTATHAAMGRTAYLEYSLFLRASGHKRDARAKEQEAYKLFGPDPATLTVSVDNLRASASQ